MHLSTASLGAVIAVAGGASAWNQAKHLVNELSFGHNGRLSGATHNDAIPHFNRLGNPKPPILSNKIILTPPAPGNQRAGLWSEKTLDMTEWAAKLDFRASGPEHASGKLQLWLVKDGQHDVGESSLYTVDKFQGLVIVVDDYGSTGGNIRGFLNDGTTSYKNHHHVDSLTFGHCEYAYRNLGRPSQLSIEQDAKNFQVKIDGRKCFESSQIKIPAGYHFGMTAASAPEPDSFELFEFVVLSHVSDADSAGHGSEGTASRQGQGASHDNIPPPKLHSPTDANDPKILNADSVAKDQHFKDLHDRLQSHTMHLAQFQQDFDDIATRQESSFAQISNMITNLGKRLEVMERKLTAIEEGVIKYDVGLLHNEMKNHIKTQGDSLKAAVDYNVVYALHKGHSKLFNFLYWMVCIQAAGVVGYLVYKKVKSSRKGDKYM